MRSSDATPPPTESPRHRRWRRLCCLWAPGLFAAWVLIGFLGVPLIVKKWIVPKIGQRLNGSIAVRECSFNPFTWRLVLRGAQIDDAAGAKVLAAEQIDANIEPLRTIFRTGWHLSWARVEGPYVRAELSPDWKLNLVNLIKPPAEPSEPMARIPRVVIDDLDVRSGEVSLTDRTTAKPVVLTWSGLTFKLNGVDTLPDFDNAYHLAASTPDGERLAWHGDLYFHPFSSTGEMTIEQLGIARFDPYLDRVVLASVTGGRVSAKVKYEFDPVAGPIKAEVTARLESVRLDREGARWIEFPAVDVRDLRLDVGKRELSIAAIDVAGGVIFTDRDEQGRWFIERMLRPAAAAPAHTSTDSSHAKPIEHVDPQTIPFPFVRLERAMTQLIQDAGGTWAVGLEKLSVNDLQFGFLDHSVKPPVRIELTKVHLAAGPVRSAEQFRTPLVLGAELGKGTLGLDGELRPAEPAVRMKVDARNIELPLLAAYIPPQLIEQLPPTELRRGAGTLLGTLTATMGAASTRAVETRWEGEATVNDIALLRAGDARPILEIGRLTHSGTLNATGTASGEATVTHEGKFDLTAVRVDVPPTPSTTSRLFVDGVKFAMETFATAGTASAHVVARTAALDAKGKLSVMGLNGDSAGLFGATKMAAESAAVEGETHIEIGSDVGGRAKGTVEFVRGHADAKNLLGPVVADVGRGKVTGTATRSIGGADTVLDVAGQCVLDDATLDGRELAGPIQARAKQLTLDGTAKATGTGVSTIVAEGTITARDAMLNGEEIAGPVEASLGSMTLVGKMDHGDDRLAWSGNVDLGELKLTASKLAGSELTCRTLKLERAALDSQGKTATIENVAIHSPKASANVAVVPREPGAATSAGAAAVALTPADLRHLRPLLEHLSVYSLAIGRAEIDGGVLQARDDLSRPPASLLVEDLKGVLTGFATKTQSPMQFEASARVQNSGKLAITGAVDLKGSKSTADARMVVESMPLPPASAVSGRYLGYLIDSGRANCTLPVKVVNSTLSGELDFRLDGFELGQEVDSPDAPGVPVKLGVALLRDADNRVAGKLPFEGRLDDPDFNFGGLIWQAVLNLVVKAATAPFQLLGALFGGGSDADFSLVTFAPGSAELSPEMLGQLDKLGTGLTERPSLNVRVIGGFDAEADTLGLKTAAWKAQALKAVRGDDKNPKALSDSEYAEAVEDAWDALKIKAAKKPTVKQMEEAVIAAMAVKPEMLEDLAARRAAAVARELVVQRNIPEARVQVGKATDAKPNAPAAEPKKAEPAVHLELF